MSNYTAIAVAFTRTLAKLGAQGIKASGEEATVCFLSMAVGAAREGGMSREDFDQIVMATWDDWSRTKGSKRS